MMTVELIPAPQVSERGTHPSLLDGRKRPRILVVDDDPAVRSMLYDLLSETGYDVDTAADGVEGLLLFELVRQDLVILDLVMPRMAGWELADRVCEIDAHVPLVALTGFGATFEADAERRDIVLVHKPVNIAALTELICSLLGWREET
jgi:DNA-binding response OmpR family regulator